MTDTPTSPLDVVDRIDLPLQLRSDDIEKLGFLIDDIRRRTAASRAYAAAADATGVLAKAQAIYRFRRTRDDEFGPKLFSDPSWDMLLDLFIAAERGKKVSISSACIASSAPATTALRHLSALVKNGLVRRMISTLDGRVHWVELTPLGHGKLNSVLEALKI